MPSLEIWEWGLKIFDGMPTLTTHADHLPPTTQTQTPNSQQLYRSNSVVLTEYSSWYTTYV